jgi:hypothetical protein
VRDPRPPHEICHHRPVNSWVTKPGARLSRAGVATRPTSTSLCVSSERSRPALPGRWPSEYYGTAAQRSPAATARYGCGGWPTVPCSLIHWTSLYRHGPSPFVATSSSPRAAGTSASTSQGLHDPYEIASCSAAPADRHDHRIMAGYPVHRRADASTAMLMACDGHTSTRSPARSVRQRWLCRPSVQAADNSRHGHWPLQRANIRRARQPDIRCITPNIHARHDGRPTVMTAFISSSSGPHARSARPCVVTQRIRQVYPGGRVPPPAA